MKDNPWMGLSPYNEPKEGEKNFFFCGRNKATAEVTSLILNNLFVTLYGKTGIGKTSLLQAGVFPYLRKRQYVPIPIRLGQIPLETNLSEYVIKQILNVIGIDYIKGLNNDIIESDEMLLWNFFSYTTFYNKEGETVFPVMVFDQFEEIFIFRKSEAWDFMRQLHNLLDDTILADEEKGQHSEANFRIIISIREDDLFRIEDCIDTLHLIEMHNCRYRLTQMSDDEAKSVILVPGNGLISESDGEELTNKIIKIAKGKNGNQLNTLLLSLICDLLYYEAKNSGCDLIEAQHLQSLGDNPLKEFYFSSIKGLSKKQKKFIEDKFVDINGRRNPVSIGDYKRVFGNDSSLLDGKKRLFNQISISSGTDEVHVELMHDLLAQTIYVEKIKSFQKRTFIQRFLMNGVFDSIILAFDLFPFVYLTNKYFDYVFIVPYGFLLVFSTYMLNVTRIHKDRRIDAFILPLLATSTIIYAGATNMDSLYAYRVIKPSLLKHFWTIFLWLNILLVCLSVYSRFILFTDEKIDSVKSLKWGDFFTVKRKENWYAQFSIVFGFLISICLLLFTPKTHIEQTRELANTGDANAMIELGNYYLKYDMDTEKAKEWFERARSEGADVDSIMNKLSTTKVFVLTDTMKTEAANALLQKMGYASLPIIKNIFETGQVDSTTAVYIKDYYDSTENGDAVMRWYSYITRNYNWKYGSLGFELWRGEYVEQDMTRAFELYVKGESRRNVIICYMNGWGTEKNPQKAEQYLKEHPCDINQALLLELQIKSLIKQVYNDIIK